MSAEAMGLEFPAWYIRRAPLPFGAAIIVDRSAGVLVVDPAVEDVPLAVRPAPLEPDFPIDAAPEGAR